MHTSRQTPIKSASRVLDVIEYIINASKPPTFTVLRQTLQIPKSSLSYLLQDLIDRNYLYFDSEMKVYFPGIKLIQIGAACINNADLSREIRLETKKLSEQLDATTHAAILDGRFVVYIAKCPGPKDLSAVTSIGFKIPAHATAVGKILLSQLSEAELTSRLAQIELERYTEYTLTVWDELLADLRLSAQRGYAMDHQEIIPGGLCIAAPIYDKTKHAIAALSVTIPALRVDEPFLNRIIDAVCQGAEHVSIRLGYFKKM